MSIKKFSFKSWMNFLGTITGWAIFIILIIIAVVLFYYFICTQKYQKYGKGYEPPFTIYTIASPSMTPNINVADVVVNLKTKSGADIKKGDVITFISTSSISKGMTITHRVMDVQVVNGEYQYITKGDNNLSSDSAPALYSNVIGIARFRLPQVGRIQTFVASRFGWLVVVIIPACWIITGDVIKLVKIKKLQKKANKINQQTVRNVETSIGV